MRGILRRGRTPVLLLLLCLPLSAAGQESAELLRLPLQPGHTHDILRFEWSPGDRLLASYSAGDGYLKVWDVEAARLLWSARTEFVRRKDEHTNIVGVVWSPDLSMLAVANVNGAVMLWDVHAGRLRWVQRDAHKSDGMGVAFNADGRFVVSAAVPDGKREVKVWEAASGAPAALERGGTVASTLATKATGEVVHNLALSGDGRLLAEGGRWGDASIKIREVAGGKVYRVLEGHPGIVHALAFSPDGSRVASGSGDRLVRLWDARTGALLAVLEGHTSAVLAVAFSPDGKLVVSAGADRTLRVWDSGSGVALNVVQVEDGGIWSYGAVAFSPDGGALAAAGGNGFVRLFDARTWAVRLLLQGNDRDLRPSEFSEDDALSVAFSPDGRTLLTGHNSGAVKLWDSRTGRLLRTLKTKMEEARAAFTHDGRQVFVVSGDDYPPLLLDARTGAVLRKFDDDYGGGYNHALAPSPEDARLATSHVGRNVHIWDVRRGKILREFDAGFSGDDAVAFSPDGRLLASGGENQNVVMWDAATGAPLWSLLPLRREEDPLATSTAPTFFELRDERERLTREADKETAAWAGRVRIAFEHFGEPSDPWQARMGETGEPSKSMKAEAEASARGVWLRLRNGAPLPISFRTYSMYMGKCGTAAEPARRFGLLCEGMEVGAAYDIVDAKGVSRAPNEIDVFSTSTLPPGTSVLFSVPREHLSRSLSVCLEYTYVKEDEKHTLKDYGSARSVCFKGSELKKAVTSDK
jgi:WD40 repeat protein